MGDEMLIFWLGAGASFLGFLGNRFLEKRARTKEGIERYRKLLLALNTDLGQQSRHMDQLEELAQKRVGWFDDVRGRPPVSPSFKISLRHLEHLRQALVDLYEDENIVELVSHCLFELQHVDSRVERTFQHLAFSGDPNSPGIQSMLQQQKGNAVGTLKLVKATNASIKQCLKLIESKIADLDFKLRYSAY